MSEENRIFMRKPQRRSFLKKIVLIPIMASISVDLLFGQNDPVEIPKSGKQLLDIQKDLIREIARCNKVIYDHLSPFGKKRIQHMPYLYGDRW